MADSVAVVVAGEDSVAVAEGDEVAEDSVLVVVAALEGEEEGEVGVEDSVDVEVEDLVEGEDLEVNYWELIS